MKVSFLAVAFIALTFAVGLAIFSASLPDIIKPQGYKPMVVSEVFAEGGEKIGEFYELRRKPVALNEIPKVVIEAFIAAEDAQFFSHKGIDIGGIVRAAIKNFRAGRFVQGGSTITQQVARSLLLKPEKKLSRKIKEVILAMRLEKELSKEEILYLYLNEIYLGHGAYGVQSASQNYFGKDVSGLNLAEASMLAGLPQAPSRYSPLVDANLAKERQLYVLGRMVEDGYISKKQAITARNEILHFLKKHDFNLSYAPYFVEHIRKYLLDKYGYQKVFQEGLRIHTTLKLDFQKAANAAVEKGLRDLDKRQGFRGPMGHLKENEIKTFLAEQEKRETFEEGGIYDAVISKVDDEKKMVKARLGAFEGEIPFKEMRWARVPDPDKYYMHDLLRKPSDALSAGDIVQVRIIEKKEPLLHLNMEQEPVVQGALLSFDHHTGFVRSMVGGYDFAKSEFNRAIQGRRQVGSTFKPIIYGAALERGYTPATLIVDSPIVYADNESEIADKWKPKNYAERFYGDTTLAAALAYSRNIVTIKIAQDIKTDYIAAFAKRLGIQSPLIEDLSMALGSSSITLNEMCQAFAVFPRGGSRVEPVFIKKIVDREGNILEEYQPPPTRENVITPQLAYLMTHLMSNVVRYGTGRQVNDLNWPLAAKTGTTSDYADAWFIGFSPDLLTGVWVGFDERRKIGEFETGSQAAIPIWKAYMSQSLNAYPKKNFPIPEGIIFVTIDGKTGKLASDKTKYSVSQAFIEGTEPEANQAQEKSYEQDQDEEQFFKEEM